jgi:transposase
MTGVVSELPHDIEALHKVILAQQQTIAHLQKEVDRLSRIVFRPKSERRRYGDDNPKQLHFLFAADQVAEAEETAEAKGVEGTVEVQPPAEAPRKKPRKPAKRRSEFPAHVPTVRTTYELPADKRVCPCCGEQLHEMGEEVSRELERIETTIVNEIARKKYACRKCGDGVVTTPGPDRVLDRALLGPGFLSHVLCERFGNHMPYYRLEQKYASEGLELSRTVLQRSAARCAELLEPIWRQIKLDVLASPVIHTDDTSVRLVHPKAGGDTRLARLWVYVDLEGRHWYDYTETRERDGPQRVLGDYRGFLHADAYAAYDRLYLPGGAIEVGCWAHARRKFIDIENVDPGNAQRGIGLIRKLYAVEAEAKERGLDAEARRQLRQEKAVPVLAEIREFLDTTFAAVLPKSPTAQAIGYALNQWEALTRYTTNGLLSIDNNAAERGLRGIAVGRKNWLFFQEETGGATAATVFTLLMTAKAIGLVPHLYLRDVLLRLAACSDVTKLTPHGWKQHFAEQVARDRIDLVERLVGKSTA